MISLAYGLHIHPCLSPCGDDDMTPANITGMTALKGLDVIALTGRNTCRSCPAFMTAVAGCSVLAVPDMGINTSEEVHAVCLFPTLEKTLDFDAYVYGKLIKFPSREEILGRQQTYDDRNQACVSEPNLLINVTEVSFDSLWNPVCSYNDIMFPAHVDKAANSLIANLGFILPNSCLRTAEVRDLRRLHQLRYDNPYLEQCRIISDSGAHYLEHIGEANPTTQVEGWSAEAMIRALLQEWQLFAAVVLWGNRCLFEAVPQQRRVIEDSNNRLETYRKVEFGPFCCMCYP